MNAQEQERKAAVALADVAALIADAGPDYVRWNLRLTGTEPWKARRDLVTDLEWFVFGLDPRKFGPDRQEQIRDAALRALGLLPAETGPEFLASARALIQERRGWRGRTRRLLAAVRALIQGEAP